VDVRLGAVARQPHHGPGKVFRIVPLIGAGGDEQLRHLVLVQITVDRHVGRRAERVVHEQHLVLLDHLAHQLDGLRRAVAVVAADEGDLAAVDAALLVDHGEIGGVHFAEHAVRRCRAAIRHGVADLDLGIAGARPVLAGRKGQSGGEDEADGGQAGQRGLLHCHSNLPEFVCYLSDVRFDEIGSAAAPRFHRARSQAASGPSEPTTPRGIAYMNNSIATPYTAHGAASEMSLAKFGTNSMKKPPTMAPPMVAMPPTAEPTRNDSDRNRLKLSGATKPTTMAESAPATAVNKVEVPNARVL